LADFDDYRHHSVDFSLTAADEPTACNSKKDRHEAIHDRSASRGRYRFAKL
jgi:hypothetical protein